MLCQSLHARQKVIDVIYGGLSWVHPQGLSQVRLLFLFLRAAKSHVGHTACHTDLEGLESQDSNAAERLSNAWLPFLPVPLQASYRLPEDQG